MAFEGLLRVFEKYLSVKVQKMMTVKQNIANGNVRNFMTHFLNFV